MRPFPRVVVPRPISIVAAGRIPPSAAGLLPLHTRLSDRPSPQCTQEANAGAVPSAAGACLLRFEGRIPGGYPRVLGKHLIVDLSEGDTDFVRSADCLRRLSNLIAGAIGAKVHRAPVLQRVASHCPELAGYTLVQLIDTFAITGHFCDSSGDAYIDVRCSKDFDTELVLDVIKGALRPKHMRYMTVIRQAPHSPRLAAE